MNVAETVQWGGLVTCWIGSIFYSYTIEKRVRYMEKNYDALSIAYKSSMKLILTENDRRAAQAKALKRLTDPDSILEDMERGARMREMRDANRTTLPREDAGPPAKVYTPSMRAKLPKSNYKRTQD